jgi:16S rRNA (guanine(966)-N(2))-methyltransferase RsmD
VRVIAGALKGRRLVSPKGRTTRPTTDRVRIACLDTLEPWLPGARFLDLFAGAGGVGIEALSRGAASAVFVETDRAALSALGENLSRLGLAERCRVLRREAGRAITEMAREGERFTIIFLDPPYDLPLAETTLAQLSDGRLLAEGGIAAVQHRTKAPLPSRAGVLSSFKARRFGETTLTFFRAGE